MRVRSVTQSNLETLYLLYKQGSDKFIHNNLLKHMGFTITLEMVSPIEAYYLSRLFPKFEIDEINHIFDMNEEDKDVNFFLSNDGYNTTVRKAVSDVMKLYHTILSDDDGKITETCDIIGQTTYVCTIFVNGPDLLSIFNGRGISEIFDIFFKKMDEAKDNMEKNAWEETSRFVNIEEKTVDINSDVFLGYLVGNFMMGFYKKIESDLTLKNEPNNHYTYAEYLSKYIVKSLYYDFLPTDDMLAADLSDILTPYGTLNLFDYGLYENKTADEQWKSIISNNFKKSSCTLYFPVRCSIMTYLLIGISGHSNIIADTVVFSDVKLDKAHISKIAAGCPKYNIRINNILNSYIEKIEQEDINNPILKYNTLLSATPVNFILQVNGDGFDEVASVLKNVASYASDMITVGEIAYIKNVIFENKAIFDSLYSLKLDGDNTTDDEEE